jgi:type II secretory pathway predicted ATPase ExeA
MESTLNRENDELIPFQEGVNVNLFFPGAHRRELLDEVKKSIADGVAVLSIIGDEGTGKTMLCRMIENELSDEFICVYLPKTLESFDEVLHLLATETGAYNEEQAQSFDETVSVIIERLKERDKKLVVIFDQAERMYLAMLERLRKLLDRINGHEKLLQLIFAGRKVLLENLDQLSICNFEDAAETHFYLDDLDMAETYAYLNHCARQRSRAIGKSIFTPEASKKIFNIARGNLKTTNILAAKSIESADDEGSFVVTPRNVNIKGSGLEGMHEPFLAGVRRKSGWLLSGAVLLLLCIVLIAFLRGEDESNRASSKQPEKTLEISAGPGNETETLSTSSNSSAEQVEPPTQEEAISESNLNESSIVFKTEPEEKAQSPLSQDQSKLDQDRSGIAPSSKNSIEKTGTGLQDKHSVEVGNDEAELQTKIQPTGPVAAELSQIKKDIQQGGAGELSPQDSKVTVSELSVREELDTDLIPAHKQEKQDVLHAPEQIKKQEKKIIVGAVEQSQQDQSGSSKILAGTKKSVPTHLQSNANPKQLFKVAQVKLPTSGSAIPEKDQLKSTMSVSTLYGQRVAAGEDLFSGKLKGSQTIQVMALTGDLAEKNLRELFLKQEYQEIADKLYILESENSSTLYVFYGAFADRESANKAREQLPPFLGNNEPYVISILDAKNKVTPQQQ